MASKRGAKRAQGMIFIEDRSTSMENACKKKLIDETNAMKEDSETKPMPMDVKAADYDGVVFHFRAPGSDPRKIEVEMTADCIPDLIKYGGDAMLKKVYAEYGVKVEETTVTLSVDSDSPPEDPEKVVEKISLMKRNLYGAPFDKCLGALAEGKSTKPFCYEYRKDGRIFLTPGDGHVAVTFQIYFADATDTELAKIVLQEFAEAQRTVPGSPQAMFFCNEAPPAAAKTAKACGVEIDNVAGSYFLSLVVNKNHVKSPEQRAKITGLLINTRTYLLYHMKCTKAYLLSRMRRKYQDLLQALARAKPLKKSDFGKKKRLI